MGPSHSPFHTSQSRSQENYQPGSAIQVGSGSILTAASPGTGFPSDTAAEIPFEQLPQWVRDLEGSTVAGRPLTGGVGELPQHGGLGNDGDYSSGTRDGYGHDRSAPLPRSLSEWTPPSNIAQLMTQFSAADSQPGSQDIVGSVDQSITGGFSTGNIPFTSTGLERQRVDSFVSGSLLDRIRPHSGAGPLVGSSLDNLGTHSGAGPLHGAVNVRDMGTFGSSSFDLSASSAGMQQMGVGIPRTDSSGFIDTPASGRIVGGSVIPGISGISGSGPLPAVGLDIYGRRQR